MEISLKKNAWHYRLQETIVGTPRFDNFCPYFWLTIACVFISPFFFLFKGLARIYKRVEVFSEAILGLIDKTLCQPVARWLIRLAPDEKILAIWHHSRDYYQSYYGCKDEKEAIRQLKRDGAWHERQSVFIKDDLRFQLWKQTAGEDWQAKFKELQDRLQKEKEEEVKREREEATRLYKLKLERELAAAAREERIRNMQLKIANFTRKVAPYFVWGFGAVLALLAIKVIMMLFVVLIALDWARVGIILGTILGCIVITVIAGFVIFVIAKLGYSLGKKCALVIPLPKRKLRISKPSKDYEMIFFKTIAKYASLVVSPFVAFVTFVKAYVKVAKKDYCPKIKWEE